MEELEVLKGLIDSKRLLDRSQYFKMIDVKKISAMLPKSWKKLFNKGIFIPGKIRFCNKCNEKLLGYECKNQVKVNKEIGANLNRLKRQPPNQLGHMLPF